MDHWKATLDELEMQIHEVKRQYDFFLQGVRRSEPLPERRALETTIRRMGQRRILNTADQFRFNALQSRFFSLVNLWTRAVRDIEEGRGARGTTEAPAPGGDPADGVVDPAHLAQVLELLGKARAECGLPSGEGDMALIGKTLAERAREISDRAGGRKIEFRVSVEEGKPKIKAVLV